MIAPPPDRPTAPPARLIVVSFVILTGAVFLLLAPSAWPTVLLDAASAVLMLAPAALAGLWLVPILGLSDVPLRWHLLLGGALGIGLLSLLVLVGGLAGVLQRGVWIAILAAMAVAGVFRLRVLWSAMADDSPREQAIETSAWLWLLLAPFLALSLAAAANAPGFLWSEEGFGYDVLEYHLQMPKEYFHAGRIAYAPHNVYASFPANVEMLYLLAMILVREDVDAGTLAHMIHLLLGVGLVFAAWVAGREWSARSGIIAALLAGTTGWLPYLSGLAYVELGMLFFGMTAAAVVVAAWRARSTAPPSPWTLVRAAPLAGLLAGLACGCKYTAVPFIALPIAVVILVVPQTGTAQRVRALGLFLIGVLTAFAPWLAKNTVMTGNPVFPLAQSVFRAQPPGWDTDSDAQWQRGHAPRETKQALGARLSALWHHLPGDHYQRYGPAIFLIPLAGWILRQRAAGSNPQGVSDVTGDGSHPPHRVPAAFPGDHRIAGALAAMLALQLLIWLIASHLFARFAVVVMIPLALLAGCFATSLEVRCFRVLAALLIAGTAWTGYFAFRLHMAESPGGAPASLVHTGQLPGYEYLRAVNEELPEAAHLLLVGDARAFYYRRRADYAVVFNRQPLAEAVRGASGPGEVMAWLRAQGYSHVLVHWLEVERLRRTYGFPAEINEELFEHLEGAGLMRLRDFAHPARPGPYVTMYEVAR